jgi:Fic family protein
MTLNFERLIDFDLTKSKVEDLLRQSDMNEINEFFNTIRKIFSIDRFIKDSPSFPGSTEKIIRNELISAIGATLQIEGTVIGKDEIEESFRKADLNEKLKRKEQEAENSRKVYYFIIEMVINKKEKFIYSEQMIKQIHNLFTQEMDYIGNTPGDYRNFPVSFGEPSRNGLCKTRTEIDTAMSNFVKWLNKEETDLLNANIIAKSIMAHYYLTEIHPFADGNGRTARALEALILYVNGMNRYCFWSLANFWSRNKGKYIVYLGDICSTQDPWNFLIWGMKGHLEEIKRIKGLVLKKQKQLMFMDYVKYLLDNKKEQKIKISQRIIDILRLLVKSGRVSSSKFLTSPEMSALYRNRTASTRSRDLKKMVVLKLVNIVEEEGKFTIEPNFNILEGLTYNV